MKDCCADLFRNALVQFQSGNHTQAAELVATILEHDPEHFQALHLAGVLRALTDEHDSAVDFYGKAVKINAFDSQLRQNFALSLARLRHFDEALGQLDRAIALAPDHPAPRVIRGNVLNEMRQPSAALEEYECAAALGASSSDFWSNRGAALAELQQYEAALASYDAALSAAPNNAKAWSNRANVLIALRRRDEALSSYDRALAIDPNSAEVWCNRGVAFDYQRRYEEALDCYERALALDKSYVQALANRGTALIDLKRYVDAAQTYASLLELAPNYPFVRGQLLYAKLFICSWENLPELLSTIAREVREGKESAEPFGYQAVCESEPDLKQCAAIYSAHHYPSRASSERKALPRGSRRLRLGYVSGEFMQQATSILLVNLIELHDRSRFELFGFDSGWHDGSETRLRLDQAFDEIVDIANLDDLSAAEAIRQREIDILVNLNGFFGRHRQSLFAARPSPIQVNYLGFPGTLGADYIDYIIADHIVIPPGHEAFYSEKVARLPHSYQPTDSRRRRPAGRPTRSAMRLPQNGFVFCCFNNNYKITPEIFAIWMRILQKVADSVLWLLEDTPAASHNLRQEAERRGVDQQRLIFAQRTSPEEHLARHLVADLFIDTLPYNAHTTCSDALWSGLPVVTCRGRTFPGRVAASLLHAAGMSDLVAETLDEYERLIIELAQDPARLAAIRGRLESNGISSPLFDTALYARHIEAAYLTMWSKAVAGKAPDHISVT